MRLVNNGYPGVLIISDPAAAIGMGLTINRYYQGSDQRTVITPYFFHNQRNHAQAQKSTCADFVDKLMSVIEGLPIVGAGTQANAGRALAKWAKDTLAVQANKLMKEHPELVPTGFKPELVQGGQNLFAGVHIAGVAGGTLIGDNALNPYPYGQKTGPYGSKTGTEMVKAQFGEDNAQLQWGLSRQKMGFTTTGAGGQPIPGYDPNHSLADFIAEKHAELYDDGAGVNVGRILEKMWNDRNFSRSNARREIFNLLCDH
jgi:hypothetical protein